MTHHKLLPELLSKAAELVEKWESGEIGQDSYEYECSCLIEQIVSLPAIESAGAVDEEMVERALRAYMPNGDKVYRWLRSGNEQKSMDGARQVMRAALTAALMGKD